ncbi:organic cation transporter-like protein [Penaeus japonicus]|uniref:organic cation transporter-like protein n=1 Tax=Penaeus japonicus TaxID=27405 RepID=UPI001C71175B|nr:organic cation transporter-like protein [Penaeus japonicus]
MRLTSSVSSSRQQHQWDLVCAKEFLSPLFQTIYTAGCFLGSILGGIAANRYGRRWAVRVGAIMTVFWAGILSISPWLSLVFASRLILGVFNTIMVYPAFMLTMEVCVPYLRSTVGVLLALPYAIMMIILAGLAYAIRDWRILQAAGSFPALLLVPLVFLVDESPRWLLVKGHLEEAVRVLERAASMNRRNLDELPDIAAAMNKIHNKLSGSKSPPTRHTAENPKATTQHVDVLQNGASIGRAEEGAKNGSLGNTTSLGLADGFGPWWAGPMALVRTKVMRRLSLVLVTVWLLQGIVYLGLPLSANAFSSPFLYMALMGAVEVPAYSVSAPITQRLGRRPVICFCLISCGLLLLSLLLLEIFAYKEEWVDLLLVLLSYLLVCTSYQVNFLYAPELLPTTIRPWGTAMCTLSAYVGFSIPPFITDYLAYSYPWLPATVFGSSAFLAGILVSFLPETNGRPLMETVADLEFRLTKGDTLQQKSEEVKLNISGVNTYS